LALLGTKKNSFSQEAAGITYSLSYDLNYIDKNHFTNIITRWMKIATWQMVSTRRAEMAVISEQDLDGLIAAIGVELKPGTVRTQIRTEIGTLIAIAKRGDPRRVKKKRCPGRLRAGAQTCGSLA
jgi:hypothetical protein